MCTRKSFCGLFSPSNRFFFSTQSSTKFMFWLAHTRAYDWMRTCCFYRWSIFSYVFVWGYLCLLILVWFYFTRAFVTTSVTFACLIILSSKRGRFQLFSIQILSSNRKLSCHYSINERSMHSICDWVSKFYKIEQSFATCLARTADWLLSDRI